MADTKISALAATTTLADADVVPVVIAATSANKKIAYSSLISIIRPGIINVKDPTYGAVGDGVTDDKAAIQAAITAAAGGGSVYIPPGNYVISSGTLTIPNGQNNLRIIGEGIGITKILNNQNTIAFELVYSSGANHDDIVFRDFTIDKTAGTPTVGIKLNRFTKGCELGNVKIDNHVTALDITDSNNFLISRLYADHSSYGIKGSGYTNSCKIKDSLFMRCSINAILLASTNSPIFSGNNYELCPVASAVVKIDSGKSIVLLGDYYEENGDGSTAARANILISSAQGIEILGNYINGILTTGADIERNIYLSDVSNVEIHGNVLLNSVNYDIIVGGVTNSQINTTGNYATGNIYLPNDGISKIISNAATLNFGVPGSVPGSVDLTITVTGASLGDTVAIGSPVAIGSDYILSGFVSAADTVTIRWTQLTGAAADPDGAGGIYRADVYKH